MPPVKPAPDETGAKFDGKVDMGQTATDQFASMIAVESSAASPEVRLPGSWVPSFWQTRAPGTAGVQKLRAKRRQKRRESKKGRKR